jgi:hypothetical protein
MKVLCQNNRANGLRTAIKTHGTLFVHRLCHWHYMCSRHGGKSDVRRHVGTKNHIDLAKVKQNCRSMKTFISSPNMTNSEIDLRKAVTKSEMIMCQLIVNLIIFLVKRCKNLNFIDERILLFSYQWYFNIYWYKTQLY